MVWKKINIKNDIKFQFLLEAKGPRMELGGRTQYFIIRSFSETITYTSK